MTIFFNLFIRPLAFGTQKTCERHGIRLICIDFVQALKNVYERNPMVYLLDGGLGSELQITGVVKVGDRLWSARPLTSEDGTKRLKAVHLNFLQAGADVVKTASYQN